MRTVTNSPDYQHILTTIAAEVAPLLARGRVADYIAPLAQVDPQQFGMAVVTLDGTVHSVGAADRRFSIQSISKLFALALAISLQGDDVWKRVGREPSGTAFNSLVQLEIEHGRPRNPFINAGALVITDILTSRFVQPEIALLQFVRTLAAAPDLEFDSAVAGAEIHSAHRNTAMAHFMKSFGNLDNPVDQVIAAYCRQCAISMNCVELARAAGFLFNGGILPWNGARILGASPTKRLNALMLTCGTYDAAGDFAYRVGLPAKSGVGGGILALVPGVLGVCVWSPGLDAHGNSLAGAMALERFTDLTGQSVF
ncbi:MAG: glutaminase [bacterium]|nr:glutaminase [bacterium]